MPARVKVDRSVMRALALEIDRAVTTGARPVVARLAASIAAASGPAAYRRVYRKLASGVAVRPVAGQPPSITIGGGGGFSGGGSISSLVGPYEYGNPRGDTARTPRHGPPAGGRRRGSQFPPRSRTGHWIGPTIKAEQSRLEAGFIDQIEAAMDSVTRRGGVR